MRRFRPWYHGRWVVLAFIVIAVLRLLVGNGVLWHFVGGHW